MSARLDTCDVFGVGRWPLLLTLYMWTTSSREEIGAECRVEGSGCRFGLWAQPPVRNFPNHTPLVCAVNLKRGLSTCHRINFFYHLKRDKTVKGMTKRQCLVLVQLPSTPSLFLIIVAPQTCGLQVSDPPCDTLCLFFMFNVVRLFTYMSCPIVPYHCTR